MALVQQHDREVLRCVTFYLFAFDTVVHYRTQYIEEASKRICIRREPPGRILFTVTHPTGNKTTVFEALNIATSSEVVPVYGGGRGGGVVPRYQKRGSTYHFQSHFVQFALTLGEKLKSDSVGIGLSEFHMWIPMFETSGTENAALIRTGNRRNAFFFVWRDL